MSEKLLTDQQFHELSKKLNVLIALSLRQLLGDKEFDGPAKRKQGAGSQARYLAQMGLTPKDISEIIGAPISSVRTLLTPSRKQ